MSKIIEDALVEVIKFTEIEFNDGVTRSAITKILVDHFSSLRPQFVVVCDETNNPPDVVDTNNLFIDVYEKQEDGIVLHFCTSREMVKNHE